MRFKGLIAKTTALLLITTICLVILLPVVQSVGAYPTLRIGSRGEYVSRLQQGLKDLGYFNHSRITGYYGPITRDSVVNYQRANGLGVDGIAGPQTFTSLFGSSSGTASAQSSGQQILRFGMRGPSVVQLQNELKQRGYFHANSTGYYGKITENAVIAFQIDNGLRVDGIAGPQTKGALYGNVSNASVSRGGSSTNLSEDDIFWLARVIHAEARGEQYLGKVAVGNVVLNRVASSSFPNSVYGVIFEYYRGIPQFSPVADGSIYNNPDSESFRAARDAANGHRPVGNALYFFNPSKAAGTWIVNNRSYITTIGNHAFYN